MSNTTKERPLILNAQEVNAVLAGNKTQHRVPVLTADQQKEGFNWDYSADGDSAIFIKVIDDERQEVLLKPCPFGAVGDRLWVQEDWTTNTVFNDYSLDDLSRVISINYIANSKDIRTGKFRPAKDMHRAASRVLLEITDISIERVHDINHSDSVKEAAFTFYPKQAVPPLSAFPRYWMEKHSDDAWRLNPWVWVLEFKIVEPSEVKS